VVLPEAAVVEKKMYQTKCATCEEAIEVPFEPDGKRPTFCKDCLRDYQRATAKARNEIAQKENVPQAGKPRERQEQSRGDAPSTPTRHVTSAQVYTPSGQPLSLAQARHIEPKKFKALRKRPAVNLSEVRELIGTVHKSDPPLP